MHSNAICVAIRLSESLRSHVQGIVSFNIRPIYFKQLLAQQFGKSASLIFEPSSDCLNRDIIIYFDPEVLVNVILFLICVEC